MIYKHPSQAIHVICGDFISVNKVLEIELAIGTCRQEVRQNEEYGDQTHSENGRDETIPEVSGCDSEYLHYVLHGHPLSCHTLPLFMVEEI